MIKEQYDERVTHGDQQPVTNSNHFTCARGGIVSGTKEISIFKWTGGSIRAWTETSGEVFLFPKKRTRRP